jgi:hypothetical protein
MAVWPVKLPQAEHGLTSEAAATPGGPAGIVLAAPMAFGPASTPAAYLSDIRRQAWARCIVDLAGLAFIDCSCLSVLVRHCKMIRGQGSFALAAPAPGQHARRY